MISEYLWVIKCKLFVFGRSTWYKFRCSCIKCRVNLFSIRLGLPISRVKSCQKYQILQFIEPRERERERDWSSPNNVNKNALTFDDLTCLPVSTLKISLGVRARRRDSTPCSLSSDRCPLPNVPKPWRVWQNLKPNGWKPSTQNNHGPVGQVHTPANFLLRIVVLLVSFRIKCYLE